MSMISTDSDGAMQDLVPKISSLRKRYARQLLRLSRPYYLRRVNRPGIERIDGLAFATLPTVFNPVIFSAGVMLGRAVEALGQVPGEDHIQALDMGCGSGVVGVYAARQGYAVTGIDVNPDAVRLARANALLNALEDRIQVRLGDLFAPVKGQRFDLICFSPPYFRGEPKDSYLSRAFWSTDVMERFMQGLPDHLTPQGRALIHLSTDGDCMGILGPAQKMGFKIDVASRRALLSETMTVYALTLPSSRAGGETVARRPIDRNAGADPAT